MDWLNSPTREDFGKKQQRVRTVKVRNARKAEERRKGKAREDGGKGHKKGWKTNCALRQLAPSSCRLGNV